MGEKGKKRKKKIKTKNKNKKKKINFIRSLKFKIISIILIFVILAIGVFAGFSIYQLKTMKEDTLADLKLLSEKVKGQVEKELKSSFKSLTKRQINGIADSIANFFQKAEFSLKIVSNDPNAKSITGEFTEESIPWLYKTLDNIRGQSNGELAYVYAGYEDGSMFSSPRFDTSEYDPRIRPWYEDAMKNPGKIVWTAPYIDFDSGELLITVAKTIKNSEGEIVGVAGSDVLLSQVQDVLNKYKAGEKGHVVAVDMKSGTYLNHPNDQGKTNSDEFEFIGKEVKIPELKAFVEGDKDTAIIRYETDQRKISVATRVPGMDIAIFGIVNAIDVEASAQVTSDDFSALQYTIESNSDRMRQESVNQTVLLGIGFLVLIILFGYFFANRYAKPILKIADDVNKLSSGDFTGEIAVNKRSIEIERATTSLEELRKKISSILVDVKGISGKIDNSSKVLLENGESLEMSSKNVTNAIEEIANGATEQATDAEHSSKSMKVLADDINELTSYNDDIISQTNTLGEINRKGVEVVEELNSKTADAQEITNKTSDKTNELSEVISSITGITDTISDIAEQTNLLALNASIEAARAGDAGRGFAVVADEIRQLAEETSKATSKIAETITKVSVTSKEVVESIQSVENINREQTEVAGEVTDAFNNIEQGLHEVVGMIEESALKLEAIENKKNDAVENIENIVAITEETAASSEEVSASVEHQHDSIAEVSDSALELKELILSLNKDLDKFNV